MLAASLASTVGTINRCGRLRHRVGGVAGDAAERGAGDGGRVSEGAGCDGDGGGENGGCVGCRG